MPDTPIATVEVLLDVIIVHVLAESLGEDQLRLLQHEVRVAADANPGRPCVLDLAGVSFMPSLSLAALIRLHSEFQGRQQRLILAAVQPQIRDVFIMTRLDRVFDMQDDVATALRTVRPG